MGILEYYRRHVKDFSKHATPLTELTKKGKKFEWTQQCEDVLRYLIDHVVNAPVLRFPITSGVPYILSTDASGISVAAVLYQIQEGKEYPIAIFSKGLNETKRRWSSSEMEVAAIVAGINAFRHYLVGSKFEVRTDNSGCLEILRKPSLSPKLYRWALLIQSYDLTIQHKAGRLNRVCDALSRVPVTVVRSIPPEDQIRVAQRQDPAINRIVQYILKEELPEGIAAKEQERFGLECAQYELIDDTLYCK